MVYYIQAEICSYVYRNTVAVSKHLFLTAFEKLIIPQLVKNFPAFYAIRMFITAVTRARQLVLIQIQIKLFHTPILLLEYLFKYYLPIYS
jgi:hypothetical protein